MIELRWIERIEVVSGIEENMAQKVKVLQYRNTNHPQMQNWQDVPTVTEATP